MRAFTLICFLAVFALGASASPAPVRPEAAAANDAVLHPQRVHVYARRPRAHP
ncbi:hypothetical protein DAEQUDRAFT_732894 [Daedalea quercina L-15889]|uniref:Uncharacterized protein n=1 Tax=Daedalea quercina L-15889 TaxID=1314783 RepID=A0A165LC64_9APHY|nr:hypothetical protein DAEQUDRAFT_732894 [Daedalea quercina L-15889]